MICSMDHLTNIDLYPNNFDVYHLYVEDYCARISKSGKKIYTIKMNKGDISHGSVTCKKIGHCWGKYRSYKGKFKKIHPGFRTT